MDITVLRLNWEANAFHVLAMVVLVIQLLDYVLRVKGIPKAGDVRNARQDFGEMHQRDVLSASVTIKELLTMFVIVVQDIVNVETSTRECTVRNVM